MKVQITLVLDAAELFSRGLRGVLGDAVMLPSPKAGVRNGGVVLDSAEATMNGIQIGKELGTWGVIGE